MIEVDRPAANVGNRAPPHGGGGSGGVVFSASDNDGGGFQARCASSCLMCGAIGSCDSCGVEILRWRVGDATILRVWEVDATPALQGLIPKFDPAAISPASWLTPNFVDEAGRLRGRCRRS